MGTAPGLHEVQRRFLSALYGEISDAPMSIVSGELDAAARLDIYRHSSTHIHVDALRSAFPAVMALVGEAFFEHTAARYRLSYPSRSGNLQTFGADFPEFLADRESTHNLPYLADVARLEWHRQNAALAADVTPLTADACQNAVARAEGPLRICLHPSVQTVASPHPILTIWRYATRPIAQRLQLQTTGEHVLLWRDGGVVAMAAIDGASHVCIDALARGFTLDEAHTRAQMLDPDFELASCIASFVSNRLVTAIVGEEDHR